MARRSALLRIGAVALAALAVGFLVARRGPAGWRAVRVVEVAALAGLVVSALLFLGRRWRGLALLSTGIIAGAAGVGVGPQWIAKAGWGLVSAAGALALVGGLACLVFGLIDLSGSFSGMLRWAWATALFLCSAVLLLSLGIAVAVTNVAPSRLGNETPAARGLAFEEARFVTADGVLLSGWYLPSANRAAVVVLHGSGSTRSSALEQAAVLSRGGYGVLLYDARGHGESGGRAMDFGWYGDLDLAAALDYLDARTDVDPDRVGALGLSMGGEQAIGAAAADPRLRAVVAEGATGRTADDKAWMTGTYGFNGWVQQRMDDLTYWFADLLTPAGPPIRLRDAAAAMAPRPLLLIAAGELADEGLAADYIRSASPATVRVWIVPGAGHTEGLTAAGAEWESTVLGFLDEALLGESPG